MNTLFGIDLVKAAKEVKLLLILPSCVCTVMQTLVTTLKLQAILLLSMHILSSMSFVAANAHVVQHVI